MNIQSLLLTSAVFWCGMQLSSALADANYSSKVKALESHVYELQAQLNKTNKHLNDVKTEALALEKNLQKERESLAYQSYLVSKYNVKPQKAFKIVKTVERITQDLEDIDVALVLSIMEGESSFKQNSVSPRGARGLMQVMYSAHPSLVKQAREEGMRGVEADIYLGVGVLSTYYQMTGDMHHALQKYVGLQSKRGSYSRSVMKRKSQIEQWVDSRT